MKSKKRSDDEIMEERGSQYGEAYEMWTTIGNNQWNLVEFALVTAHDKARGMTIKEKAHLACMNMVVVKMVRSMYDQEEDDNYADARNYLTIAQKITKNA